MNTFIDVLTDFNFGTDTYQKMVILAKYSGIEYVQNNKLLDTSSVLPSNNIFSTKLCQLVFLQFEFHHGMKSYCMDLSHEKYQKQYKIETETIDSLRSNINLLCDGDYSEILSKPICNSSTIEYKSTKLLKYQTKFVLLSL